MKIYIILILSSFSFITQAANFKVLQGRLHNGGNVSSDVKNHPTQSDAIVVGIQYEIIAKPFVPVPREHLKGTYEQSLPEQFMYEEIYLHLEKVGSLKIEEATAHHLGRVTIGRYIDAHKIKISPDNNKSEIIAIYHPEVIEMGWFKIFLTIKNIPILGDYMLEAHLIE
jgi:hypothetical protein